jgi:hypothetical protein
MNSPNRPNSDPSIFGGVPYVAKNIGVFEDGKLYMTAAQCFVKYPNVTLATWKRIVGQGKCGVYILHKASYYVEATNVEEYVKTRGWTTQPAAPAA